MALLSDEENDKQVKDITYYYKYGNTFLMTMIMHYLYQSDLSPGDLLRKLGLVGNEGNYKIAKDELMALHYIDERWTGKASGDKKMLFVTPLGLSKRLDYEAIFKSAGLSRAEWLSRK